MSRSSMIRSPRSSWMATNPPDSSSSMTTPASTSVGPVTTATSKCPGAVSPGATGTTSPSPAFASTSWSVSLRIRGCTASSRRGRAADMRTANRAGVPAASPFLVKIP